MPRSCGGIAGCLTVPLAQVGLAYQVLFGTLSQVATLVV